MFNPSWKQGNIFFGFANNAIRRTFMYVPQRAVQKRTSQIHDSSQTRNKNTVKNI